MTDSDWCETPGIKDALNDLIAAAKKQDRPILIKGNTGVGKTYFYKTAEKTVLKKKGDMKPVKPVNCAAIPKDLLDSEFFGYVKGAFTGAKKDTDGLIAAAENKILILDEIGELPKYLQAKLLTFFDTKTIKPIGSTDGRSVETFVVATSNAPQENFRDDFWHRFKVINIPSLFERRKDILYLLKHFFNHEKVEKTQAIGTYLLDFLCDEWPGNVRQLIGKLDYLLKDIDTEGIRAVINTSELKFIHPLQELKRCAPLSRYIWAMWPDSIREKTVKKFPLFFGTESIDLKSLTDESIEKLYREFLLFCWHLSQDPHSNQNILKCIERGKITWHSEFRGRDPECDRALLDDIKAFFKTKSSDEDYGPVQYWDSDECSPSSAEPVSSNPQTLDSLCRYTGIPSPSCNMNLVPPKQYTKHWIRYQLSTGASQKELSKKYSIPEGTLSNWKKKYL
jgi:hypothetical protein